MAKWFSCVNLCTFLIIHLCTIPSILATPATANFTHYPPSVLYVSSEGTARFVWNYHVDDREKEFKSESPRWSFIDQNGSESTIGADDKYTNNWDFVINRATCPPRLLNPDRVSRELPATLVITNVTTADNGIYQCSLELKAGPRIHQVQLVVTVSPQFNPQLPPTKNIAEGQDLSLPCTAIGPPKPNVTWVQILGHVIKSTGTGSATLMIPNIRRDQNGRYECQAWNNPNEGLVTAQTVVTVHYPPQTNVTPASITVVQGNEIQLSCTATGNPPPSISWTKADGVIKAGHSAAGGTLRISDAIKTDAGRYICTAKNTYDSKEHIDIATAAVVLKYQPSITHDKLLNQTVNETESLSIKCDADGYPTPIIKWKTPSGSVYTAMVYNISSASRSDAGTYTCTASNGIGREAVASIQVTVQYPPKIDVSKSSPPSKSWNGSNIHLECFATGLPSPQISWYKPTNQHITTGVNIVPRGSEVTVLTTTDQGDYGQYKCRATNILGSDEHIINVTQLFPPGPVDLMITEVEASSITVRWTKPTNDGGSPVTGYLLQISTKLPEIKENTKAVITGLKANTKYTIKVCARNIVNYGQVSIKVITTKKQGKPALPELTVTLSQTPKLSVKLNWTKPDDNGGKITKYTIYMMEGNSSEWTKINDISDPTVLEYTVIKDIEHGKTYKFVVTAWNKYGESTKYGGMSKKIPEKKSTNDLNKGKNTSDDDSSNDAAIAGGVGAVLLLMLIAAIILVFIIRKKGLLSKGSGRNSNSSRAAYHNDIDRDSVTQHAAADDGIATYAAVDISKKKKMKKEKESEIPNYAEVDKSKKKRPGEIIYAELADFNTSGAAASATPPTTYTETAYADISQFQTQNEPEPMYANFPGRSKNYSNIQGM